MNLVGSFLSFLLLLAAIQSSYYFLAVEKIGLAKWFFFNACAPLSIFYLIGFILFLITQNKFVLALALPGLLFFAIKGLIVFSWTRPVSQIGHIIMLLNSLYALYLIFKSKSSKLPFIGVLVGIVLLLVFNFFQIKFVSKHEKEFKKIMPIKSVR